MATTAETPSSIGGRAASTATAILLPVASVAVLLGLWELAPRAGWIRPTSLPPFTDVIGEVVEVLGSQGFLTNLGSSAERWAVGFALAILIGVPLGTLMGRWRPLYTLVDPLLVVGYPVPKAALILIFVLWWGAGNVSRVAIIIVGCLIPIVISSYHGAHGIEPRLLWSARGLGTGRIKIWFRVILPAALPQILSGLRLGIAISIFTLLGSELLIRGDGVGAFMFTALDNGQTLRVFAMSTIVAVIGFLLDFLSVKAVRRGLPWLEGEV
jgi:NitT/TauT family transport system permease protein